MLGSHASFQHSLQAKPKTGNRVPEVYLRDDSWGTEREGREGKKEGRKANERFTNEWAALRATGAQSLCRPPGTVYSVSKN